MKAKQYSTRTKKETETIRTRLRSRLKQLATFIVVDWFYNLLEKTPFLMKIKVKSTEYIVLGTTHKWHIEALFGVKA